MADVKISALPAASTPLTGGEVLPVVQSGVTTKVAVSNLTAGLAGTASININGTVGATTPTTGAFTSGTFSTTLGVTGTSTLATVNASGSILAASGGNYLTTGAAPVYIGGRSTTGDGYIGVNMKVGVGNYVVNGFAGQIIFGPTGAWDFNTAASGTAGNAVSDTSKMTISNAGAVTMPTQPAFLAYNSVEDLNVTGNGGVVTVDFDTEVFDQGSNFASDTFTAPVTGRYRFSTAVYLTGIVAATSISLTIMTSNRNYSVVYLAGTYTGDQEINGSALCDMDAADTAYVRIIVGGMAGNTADIYGDATSTLYTYFSGELVC